MDTMTCPDCGARIGNRRGDCRTCNRFVAAVTRRTCAALRTAFSDTHATLKAQTEAEVYAELTQEHQ